MEKKNKIISYVATGVLIVLLATATYAYFQNQVGNTVTANINIATDTVNTLTFRVSDLPTLNVTQANFSNGGNNAQVAGWAEATLMGKEASDSYYVYLNIEENGIEYTDTENNTPELLLTVTKQEDNGTETNVELTGLGSTTTQNGVTGYDITGYVGLIEIAAPANIAIANGSISQKYNITVTLINQDYNQNENAGKTFESKIIIGHDAYSAEYSFTQGANSTWDGESDLTLTVNQNLAKFQSLEIDDTTVNSSNYTLASGNTVLTLSSTYLGTLASGEHEVVFNYTDGSATTSLEIPVKGCQEDEILSACIIRLSSTNEHIIHHNGTITPAVAGIDENDTTTILDANDDSYRYAGSNSTVNDNYVCFGYNRETAADSNSNNIPDVCESGTFSATSDYAYRMIGVFKDVDGNSNDAYYVKLIKATSYGSYHWDNQSSTSSNASNNFADSQLFSTTLNGASSSYLATLTTNKWNEPNNSYIAQPVWNVGGCSEANCYYGTAKKAYTAEMSASDQGATATNDTYKIGLMYVNDYAYATTSNCWKKLLNAYNTVTNWLWYGTSDSEWTISRVSDDTRRANYVSSSGNVGLYGNVYAALVVRPVLYLSSSTKLEGNRLGTINSPYMLSL